MICLRLAKFFQPFKIRLLRIFCTWLPLRPSEDTPVEYPGRDPGVQFRSVMPNYVVHVLALGEQIIDIAKFGISDNF